MQDYRYILEKLYEYRGKKSGKNWLLYITFLETNSPQEKYIEQMPYIVVVNLKKFLLKNFKRMIHSSIIRNFIEKSIRFYDEEYIGNIGNILYIIESLDEDPIYNDSILMKEIKRIFH